jgi:hypothetical protein
VLTNPVVREFARTVRRHVEDGVVQEVIEVIGRLVRGSSRAKAHAEREER